MRGLGGDGCSLRFCKRGLSTFPGHGQGTNVTSVKCCQFPFDSLDFRGNSRKPLALFPSSVFKAVALGGEIRKLGREVGKYLFSRTKRRGGLRNLGINSASATCAFARFSPDGFLFRGNARDCLFGINGKALFALCIGGELNEPQVEFDDAVFCPG